MRERSPRRSTATVLAAVGCAIGGAGCFVGLSLILASTSGPEGGDPHGYSLIFGALVILLALPFLMTGLLTLLPPRISTWLARVTMVIILAFLGLLLIQLW